MRNVFLIFMIFVFAAAGNVFSREKFSEQLTRSIHQQNGDGQYYEALVVLKGDRPIISEIFPGMGESTPGGLLTSTRDNLTAVNSFLRSRLGAGVLQYEILDGEKMLVVQASAAALVELSELWEVEYLDVVDRSDEKITRLENPAVIPAHFESYSLHSGTHDGIGKSAGSFALVYREVVRIKDVPWMRLFFNGGDLGKHSYLVLTSLKDGAWQRLEAQSLQQWQFTSAYFNGDAVELKLFVNQFDKAVFISMDEVMVGEIIPPAPIESQCGPTDDRIPSNNPAAGRLMNIGCTGWIITNGLLVSAGHCLDGSGANVMEFNVPLSLPNGTVQHPGPDDQYAVDVSSKNYTNGGIGNDWGTFEVFDNPNTGLPPIVAQGAAFTVVQNLTPDSIRITGYGVDNGTANQTQQTDVGPNAGSSGTTMRYRTDTEGGNSGSPVIDWSNGTAVGVHTHGGCTVSGGNNSGTSAFHPDFWAAVNVPGKFIPDSAGNFAAYSDYTTPSSMRLTWNDPDHLLNGDTLFAADFNIQIYRDSVLIDSVDGGSGQYVDSGLNDGQRYHYSILPKLKNSGFTGPAIETSWIAGGSPIPTPPGNVGVSKLGNQVMIFWRNARQNIDGTPLDDLAGVNLYMDGAMVTAFSRSNGDSGKLDSAMYIPGSPGAHFWSLTSVDDETPQNESAHSATVVTPLDAPVKDIFAVFGEPSSLIWRNVNSDINDRSLNPPSAPFALNLNGKPNGADTLELLPIDLSGMQASGVYFTYQYQPQGQGNAPETDDSLKFEFRNDLSEWVTVQAYPGTAVLPFRQVTLALDTLPAHGGTFFHTQFQVRISSIGSPSTFTPNDDWFVDNIYLGLPGAVAVAGMDTLNFDTTLVTQTSVFDLPVYDIGTDTLRVSGIISTNPVFAVDTSQFAVAPGSNRMVQVSFSPQLGGIYTGQLKIVSNDTGADTLLVYLTGVGEGITSTEHFASLPGSFALARNYPNPFNPGTNIHFEVPQNSRVKLEIFNILGQRVLTLVNKQVPAGRYDVVWNGRNAQGKAMGSGIYIYRMTAKDFRQTRRMLLMK